MSKFIYLHTNSIKNKNKNKAEVCFKIGRLIVRNSDYLKLTENSSQAKFMFQTTNEYEYSGCL